MSPLKERTPALSEGPGLDQITGQVVETKSTTKVAPTTSSCPLWTPLVPVAISSTTAVHLTVHGIPACGRHPLYRRWTHLVVTVESLRGTRVCATCAERLGWRQT